MSDKLENKVTRILRNSGLKATIPRIKIMTFLFKFQGPYTAEEILQSLPKGSCDLATVYRFLGQLEVKGIVKRSAIGKGGYRYEFQDPEDTFHSHNITCRQCGNTTPMKYCFLSEVERMISDQNGYSELAHSLEFFGVCPNCQAQ